jgi:hypothetical protein
MLQQRTSLPVLDLSYVQFPSLLAVVESVEHAGNINVNKNLVVCISLLCPFFTCFYQYQHKVQLDDKMLFPLNRVVFLSDKKLTGLKPNIDANIFENTVKSEFKDHSFLSHYYLMHNKIVGGLPFGLPQPSNFKVEHSIYQFLFNADQPETIFQ